MTVEATEEVGLKVVLHEQHDIPEREAAEVKKDWALGGEGESTMSAAWEQSGTKIRGTTTTTSCRLRKSSAKSNRHLRRGRI